MTDNQNNKFIRFQSPVQVHTKPIHILILVIIGLIGFGMISYQQGTKIIKPTEGEYVSLQERQKIAEINRLKLELGITDAKAGTVNAQAQAESSIDKPTVEAKAGEVESETEKK